MPEFFENICLAAAIVRVDKNGRLAVGPPFHRMGEPLQHRGKPDVRQIRNAAQAGQKLLMQRVGRGTDVDRVKVPAEFRSPITIFPEMRIRPKLFRQIGKLPDFFHIQVVYDKKEIQFAQVPLVQQFPQTGEVFHKPLEARPPDDVFICAACCRVDGNLDMGQPVQDAEFLKKRRRTKLAVGVQRKAHGGIGFCNTADKLAGVP